MRTPDNRMLTHREERPHNGGRPPIGVRWPEVLPEARNVCPNCGSTVSRVYKTEHYTATVTKRLHRCANCGITVERHEDIG